MRSSHDDVEFRLEVTEVEYVAERVRALVLRRPDGGPLPEWAPGAHIDLVLAGDLVRQFSLYGDPGDRSHWRVAVLREDQSRGGSAYVHSELAAGTTLPGRGPRNHFPLVSAPRYLLVAGGIGITPLIPMAAELESRGVEWSLVYGGRSRAAMAFADELLARHGDRVRLLPEDETGLLPVSDLLSDVAASTAVYCCGPESLLTAVERAHAEAQRGTLHVERFSPRDLDEPPSRGTFEVVAQRSGAVVQVGPQTSILDALATAGVHLLSSCTEGLCGTCEVFVVDGRPDHRDSILTEAERSASATMFPCVSRCLSPRLVLDV